MLAALATAAAADAAAASSEGRRTVLFFSTQSLGAEELQWTAECNARMRDEFNRVLLLELGVEAQVVCHRHFRSTKLSS